MTALYAVTLPMELQPGDLRTEVIDGVATPMLTEDMTAILRMFHIRLGSVIQERDAHGYTTLRLYGAQDCLELFVQTYDYRAYGQHVPLEKIA